MTFDSPLGVQGGVDIFRYHIRLAGFPLIRGGYLLDRISFLFGNNLAEEAFFISLEGLEGTAKRNFFGGVPVAKPETIQSAIGLIHIDVVRGIDPHEFDALQDIRQTHFIGCVQDMFSVRAEDDRYLKCAGLIGIIYHFTSGVGIDFDTISLVAGLSRGGSTRICGIANIRRFGPVGKVVGTRRGFYAYRQLIVVIDKLDGAGIENGNYLVIPANAEELAVSGNRVKHALRVKTVVAIARTSRIVGYHSTITEANCVAGAVEGPGHHVGVALFLVAEVLVLGFAGNGVVIGIAIRIGVRAGSKRRSSAAEKAAQDEQQSHKGTNRRFFHSVTTFLSVNF